MFCLFGFVIAKLQSFSQGPLGGAFTWREREPLAAAPNSTDYGAQTISIPVDHFTPTDNRTYQNRYWVNDTYYQEGGPVFFFDAGEQDAAPLVPNYLREGVGPSAPITLAKRFNGLAVLFEHRFYGNLQAGSYPFPVNQTTGEMIDGYAAYKYLTTEQALEDPVYLANHFQPAGLEPFWTTLHPSKTPWIWIGGSYPGIRGAHMRVRNPETFFATWASSAPTQAAVDMWQYYAQAERSMTRNCSADYTAITKWVDRVLSNGTAAEITQLKIQLYTAIEASPSDLTPIINASVADSLTNTDVGNLLLIPFSNYQSCGFEASILPFCNIFQTRNQTAISTTDNGGTTPAIAFESGIYAATSNITLTWQAFLTGLVQMDYDSIQGPADQPVADYSWTWQYCSEYGFYQRGNAQNPHTIESSFLSLDYIQQNCDNSFSFKGLPAMPNVDAVNKYGGWNINPTNIVSSLYHSYILHPSFLKQ